MASYNIRFSKNFFEDISSLDFSQVFILTAKFFSYPVKTFNVDKKRVSFRV